MGLRKQDTVCCWAPGNVSERLAIKPIGIGEVGRNDQSIPVHFLNGLLLP